MKYFVILTNISFLISFEIFIKETVVNICLDSGYVCGGER